MRRLAQWGAAALFALLPSIAFAQGYPEKAVKVVVPFAAGGPADSIARIVSERMGSLLGNSFVIENRPGAGGTTGVLAVAKSAPDGYTIGVAATGALAINVALQEKMPYDVFKDLSLVTQLVEVPSLLVVGDKFPAKTLAEFIAVAKAQPGKLNFGSAGLGGTTHLAVELLKSSAGIDLVHVPYGGAAPAVNDLLGGHVHLVFADIPVLLGAVQAGKLRALAVGSRARVPSLPDVPSTVEAGHPRVVSATWYGMIAPAGTPAAIVGKLQSAAAEALRSSEVREKLKSQGADIVGSSSEQFTGFVRAEIDRWGEVGRAAGVKLK